MQECRATDSLVFQRSDALTLRNVEVTLERRTYKPKLARPLHSAAFRISAAKACGQSCRRL